MKDAGPAPAEVSRRMLPDFRRVARQCWSLLLLVSLSGVACAHFDPGLRAFERGDWASARAQLEAPARAGDVPSGLDRS